MKKKKVASRRVLLKNFGSNSVDFLQLYGIYREAICPDLTYAHFVQLYCADNLVAIDFTIFSFGHRRVGFSAAFFYSTFHNGRRAFIARSATGLISEFRGQGCHNKLDLYFKFIRFAFLHILTPMWAAAFIVNALVFSSLCRSVPTFFPRPAHPLPKGFEEMMNEMLDVAGYTPDPIHPYSIRVPIQVAFDERLLKRIYGSADANVHWYLKENPGFLDKFGLFVVIPVSLQNICGTILRLLRCFYRKKIASLFVIVKGTAYTLKQKTTTFVTIVLNKWIL